MSLADFARDRDDLLERIASLLAADTRVVAAWLSGSFGRGVEDAWSDLDLHVAIEDAALPGFLDERDALYRRVGEPLLVQREMPSNAMPGSTFQLVIYPGPVEVDWTIGPESVAGRVPETRLLFARREIPVTVPPQASPDERRAMAGSALEFFWAMAPIAVKYAGRGESRHASSQVDLLTGAFIQAWRVVTLPDGPNPTAPYQNRATEPALDAVLPRLEWEITPSSALDVIRELCAAMERLHPELEALGTSPPHALAREVGAMADLAAAAIERGPSVARRPYR